MMPDALIASRLALILWCALFYPLYASRVYYSAFLLLVAVMVPDGLEYAPLLFAPVELFFVIQRSFIVGKVK